MPSLVRIVYSQPMRHLALCRNCGVRITRGEIDTPAPANEPSCFSMRWAQLAAEVLEQNQEREFKEIAWAMLWLPFINHLLRNIRTVWWRADPLLPALEAPNPSRGRPMPIDPDLDAPALEARAKRDKEI